MMRTFAAGEWGVTERATISAGALRERHRQSGGSGVRIGAIHCTLGEHLEEEGGGGTGEVTWEINWFGLEC